jgi:catechol 2,3-dioxygenase
MQKQSFQAPADLQLGAVSLRVRDLEAASEFYTNFLGLALLREEPDRVELGFYPGQPLVSLSALPEGIPRRGDAPGLYHFALLVPDRQSLAHALKKLLHSGYSLQGFADHFVSEAIYLADPQGNGIEIYADRPRETWRTEGGQLRIGTVALDIEALLGLANEDEEIDAILGKGTVMGHIHLQVSNLQAASSFYERVLGFDSMGAYGNSAAFYSAGGYHHHIGLNTWASANRTGPGPEMLGLDHYEIIYRERSQLEALIESLVRAGSSMDEADEGVWLKDPSGNQLKVKVAPGRSSSA